MSGQCVTYPVVVEPGYRNWVAYVPDLPICVATGKTRAAVKRSIGEAMRFHMECLQDSNEAIPEPWTSTAMVPVESSNSADEHASAREYLVVVEPEAGGWLAYVPDIHGCSATGSTRTEAEGNIRRALASCLAGMRARGEPIPVPGRRTALIEVQVPAKDSALEPSGRDAR